MTMRAHLIPLTSTLFTLALSLSSLPVHADVDAHRLYLQRVVTFPGNR